MLERGQPVKSRAAGVGAPAAHGSAFADWDGFLGGGLFRGGDQPGLFSALFAMN